MRQKTQPYLTRVAQRKYHCDDINALHDWLEKQGYRFYGQHDPGEYGRFSLQEAHELGDRTSYVHSFIQVWQSGEVYTPDPEACALLDRMVEQPR
jgi:hypothetical protein